MIDYIKGSIIELSPTNLCLECSGIGYNILISLQTYDRLNGKSDAQVFIHHYLREDEEQFYGFADRDERELFRMLISVSGVGLATARMMLSSLTCNEIRTAIISDDVNKIKSVKGIGLKTAQRLTLELRDKVSKGEGSYSPSVLPGLVDNSVVNEATSALVMLGFTKPNVSKVLSVLVKENPNYSLEDLIRISLKRL